MRRTLKQSLPKEVNISEHWLVIKLFNAVRTHQSQIKKPQTKSALAAISGSLMEKLAETNPQ